MAANLRRRLPMLALLTAVLIGAAVSSSVAGGPAGSERPTGQLPRFEGPDRPSRPAPQSLEPLAIPLRQGRAAPTTGLVRSHAEYEPVAGVLYKFDRWGWPDLTTEMVAALTADPATDEIAWVLVATPQQQRRAENLFADAGVDMSRVVFIEMPTETIWTRDWGPQFVWLDDTLAIVDNRYFTSRPDDNFIPRRLAEDFFAVPIYESGLWHFGGNFLASSDRQGFVTSIALTANPAFGDARVAELFGEYQGIDMLHVFPALPSSVDATGHIDMWLQLVDQDTAVVSQFPPGSDPAAIAITDNAADYMEQALGYEVFRLPAHNGPHPWAADTHFTYTNAFRVNDRIFVPTYAGGDASHAARDGQALAVWQQAAPGAQIVPINAWEIVYAAGTLHCTVMQVPRYVATDPSASVIAPAGGERLVPGTVQRLEWSASDDVAVDSIDLSYSTDDGTSWVPIASGLPHTRGHDWTVPDEPGSQGRVRVVAHDDAAGSGGAISAGAFSIVAGAVRSYDYSTGAGIEHRAWGHHAAGWSAVSGQRRPVALATELTPAEYLALAASDASGDDGDPGRFRSPVPPSGSNAAHVFEFTIDEVPALWLELAVTWEGYGDSCQQVELYVWDRLAQDWCDGAGNCGQKRYLDAASGNRDVTMRGVIRQDFNRYVDGAGRVALLLITAGTIEETLHDTLAVQLKHVGDIDHDGDGVPDALDCVPADATIWSVPGEASDLHPSPDPGGTRLDWQPPADPGAQSPGYDLLASSSPAAFDLAACIASGLTTTSAIDGVDPAAGELRSYLVRATNVCGSGSLGEDSAGLTRVGTPCP